MNVRRVGKTLVSMGACAISLALFTATSRSTFVVMATEQIDETIVLDGEGKAAGVLTVRLDAKIVSEEPEAPYFSPLETLFRVKGPEARKSLKVRQSDSEEEDYKVRNTAAYYTEISDCWGEDPEPEEIVDCELSVPLEFNGKKDREEPVTFVAEAGGWDGQWNEFEVTLRSLTWVPAVE